MEITVNIVEFFEDHLRVRTVSKKQEVDIFFPPSKAEAVNALYNPHMVTSIVVEIETAHVVGIKMAKLWLRQVTFPNLPNPETHTGIQKDRYMKIRLLYKQTAQK